MDWTNCSIEGVATFQCLEVIFQNVVTVLGALAGFLFLIMLIWGGFRYLTSAGNPKSVEAAKGTITWALLGVVLLVLAYIILLILGAFTGLSLTTFSIYQP